MAKKEYTKEEFEAILEESQRISNKEGKLTTKEIKRLLEITNIISRYYHKHPDEFNE
nr:hypothetical protein [uncultured Draconibacterium sp.]